MVVSYSGQEKLISLFRSGPGKIKCACFSYSPRTCCVELQSPAIRPRLCALPWFVRSSLFAECRLHRKGKRSALRDRAAKGVFLRLLLFLRNIFSSAFFFLQIKKKLCVIFGASVDVFTLKDAPKFANAVTFYFFKMTC